MRTPSAHDIRVTCYQITRHQSHVPPKSRTTKVTHHQSHVPPKSRTTKVTYHQSHVPPKSRTTKVTRHQSQCCEMNKELVAVAVASPHVTKMGYQKFWILITCLEQPRNKKCKYRNIALWGAWQLTSGLLRFIPGAHYPERPSTLYP